MLRTSNPVFNEKTFADNSWQGVRGELANSLQTSATRAGTMTIQGTAIKTGLLVAICTASAIASFWAVQNGKVGGGLVFFGGMISSLVLALIISFKQTTAPFLSPLYAICKGALLGALTLFIASRVSSNNAEMFTKIIGPAIGLTLGIAFALALAYAFGLIRIGSTMMKVIVVATMGVGLLYLAQILLSLFNIPFLMMIHQSGPIGIAFSLFVIVLASLNLVLTFQLADDGVKAGAPKYMEWYAGFGILVELAWLYVEILRLLSKLRRD
jgi:uncharacterized YccA/Bax inhibitor family protein